VLLRYDDHPDGKMDLAEFDELIRDLDAGVMRAGPRDTEFCAPGTEAGFPAGSSFPSAHDTYSQLDEPVVGLSLAREQHALAAAIAEARDADGQRDSEVLGASSREFGSPNQQLPLTTFVQDPFTAL